MRQLHLHLLPSSFPLLSSYPISLSPTIYFSPFLSESSPLSNSVTPTGRLWSLHVPDLAEQRRELVVAHAPGGEHLGVVVVEGAQLR